MPFGSPKIEQAEIDEVIDSLKTGWLAAGSKVQKFEQMFKDYKGSKFTIALNSGTAALHLSLLSIGLKEGDEVIVPAMTFSATANAVIHTGAKPVFVDCEKETMNIDFEDMERKITFRTKAIFPVHFAGRPCKMKAIMIIAQKHQLKVVEDSTHAIEAEYQNKKSGTFGDSGEVGMVITDNEDYAGHIKALVSQGISKDSWMRFSESNYKHY